MGGWFGGGGGGSSPIQQVIEPIAEAKKTEKETNDADGVNKKGRPVTPTTYGGDMLGGGAAGGVMPKPGGNNSASLVRKVLLGQ